MQFSIGLILVASIVGLVSPSPFPQNNLPNTAERKMIYIY